MFDYFFSDVVESQFNILDQLVIISNQISKINMLSYYWFLTKTTVKHVSPVSQR